VSWKTRSAVLRPQSDGTVHQKAFAGQTFDRTVHKGDLTGIEIVNRLPSSCGAAMCGAGGSPRA